MKIYDLQTRSVAAEVDGKPETLTLERALKMAAATDKGGGVVEISGKEYDLDSLVITV